MIVFDVVASVASRVFSFPYMKASIGSFAIYFAVGYFAARATDQSRVWVALLADVFVGFTDGTIGWAVSFLIGPKAQDGTHLGAMAVLLWICDPDRCGPSRNCFAIC